MNSAFYVHVTYYETKWKKNIFELFYLKKLENILIHNVLFHFDKTEIKDLNLGEI